MENVDKSVKKAKEVLEEISSDEHERYLADLRIRCLMQKQGIEEAGFDRGFEKGIEQGVSKRSAEIAKKLKQKNLTLTLLLNLLALQKKKLKIYNT